MRRYPYPFNLVSVSFLVYIGRHKNNSLRSRFCFAIMMKRLITVTLFVVLMLFATTCPFSQTRPRRVTQSNAARAETRNPETTERPVERPRNRNWMRILGTAAMIGVAGGSCTPSRDVFRRRPRL